MGYSRVEALIAEGRFKNDHFAHGLPLTDPIVPSLDYFLSLADRPGFQSKLNTILKNPRGSRATNNRRIQWLSCAAELNAFYLLGHVMGGEIVDFDRTSPKAVRPNSNCDAVVRLKNHEVFVEIKRKSAEEKQMLPELFEDRLAELRLPFRVVPELFCPNYDCGDLELQIERLQDHVRQFENSTLRRSKVPVPFVCTAFKVSFFEKGSGDISFFLPDFEEQIRPYIVGSQESMVKNPFKRPMIAEAVDKGADYLFVHIPDWRDTAHIAEVCFGKIHKLAENSFVSSSDAFQGLAGVALFFDARRFSLINNSENMLAKNMGLACAMSASSAIAQSPSDPDHGRSVELVARDS